MLISRVTEDEGRAGEGEAEDANEYQTADELFELMARDHNYDVNSDESLTTRDLVILYKNIDVGTKLMSNANDMKCKKPNQHVETVVYKDDRESDDTDISEIYSNEDLNDMFMINNEKINLINNMPSFEHNLCHKFGDIQLQASNLSTEYDKHFLFKDPYIQQQLKNINIMPETKGLDSMLPSSLLDYICCKRLEDNYNFYMDNIIIYVQHTIEQLKRISNGDYLTDKAKKKWREVQNDFKIKRNDNTKVLANSVSIPLHVERKVNGHRSTWDDIVHSEVDIRSLSKILEKKIVIEVPKLLCGSYRLFSKYCADNLIISCKKEDDSSVIKEDEDEDDSRVDVIFQLKRSGSGHVISNINSIMILQKIPSITASVSNRRIQFQNMPFGNHSELKCCDNIETKIVQMNDQNNEDFSDRAIIKEEQIEMPKDKYDTIENNSTRVAALDDRTNESIPNYYCSDSNESSDIDKETVCKPILRGTNQTEDDYTLMTPDELRCTIQRLNMQTPVPEESEELSVGKKKSTTRVRIKSPYENHSVIIEEKKRKRLLEIREKREKKKIALGENCKVTKHKYVKGAVMAQASSSVTKLSISNKSFYNSIYGETVDSGLTKRSRKWHKIHMGNRKDVGCEDEFQKSSLTTLDINCLDDGTTETVIQMQQYKDIMKESATSASTRSKDYNVNILSQLMGSSYTDCSISDDNSGPVLKLERCKENAHNTDEEECHVENLSSHSLYNVAPANTPKVSVLSDSNKEEKKTAISVECRKSIDKIYELMKKMGKGETSEVKIKKRLAFQYNSDNINTSIGQGSSVQVSDSGTSVKHHIVSSNPSSFSFGKLNYVRTHEVQMTNNDKNENEAPTAVVPKVIISSKIPSAKVDTDKPRRDRKRNVNSPSVKVPDNPLKAISQLLHEFDNVQKTRHKTHRKHEHVLADGKTISRQGSSKRQRQSRDAEPANVRVLPAKDRKLRASQRIDAPQVHRVTYFDDRHMNKITKRNICDIIDEAKEARGEAVRGPSKPYSRLNTLAQPKKSYVQAHSEEHQSKFGKNVTASRLPRLSTTTPVTDKNLNNMNARNKRRGPEPVSLSSTKPTVTPVPPIERNVKPRRSASNSPARKRATQVALEPPYKQNGVPENPENLKKKMVAVESYVQSHYGHMALDTNEPTHGVHKSRVPLIPNDIELESITSSPTAEESTAIGKKLHYMIDTMISTNAPGLSVVTECKESTTKLDSTIVEKLSKESMPKVELMKSESDYPVDIFEDKNIVTAVASIPRDKINEDKVDESNDAISAVMYDLQSFSSATELRKLEKALYQRISVGSFPKRLRIKNLTLTPKHSLQQVLVLQSGDAGSLLLKPSLSQSLRLSKTKTDSTTALKPMSTLSNTQINWGFSNIPMQVTTVGYAFPKYQSIQNSSISYAKFPEKDDLNCQKLLSIEDIGKSVCKSNKTSQCFKGLHTKPCLEQATQADFKGVANETYRLNVTNTVKPNKEVTTEPEKTILENCMKADNITSVSTNPETRDEEVKDLVKSIPSENIDHCTSLDILMGLMNEIRKITGETLSKKKVNDTANNDTQSKELEIILNNAVRQESSVDHNCQDLVSVTSLDKLKEIDSNQSLYCLTFLNNEVHVSEGTSKHSNNFDKKTKNLNKEVNVDMEKQYVDGLTDVPSCFFPITINHSTNITNSLIEIISEPSTHSLYSFAEYETLYCNSSFNKISGLPQFAIKSIFPTLNESIDPKKGEDEVEDIVAKKLTLSDVKDKSLAIIEEKIISASNIITKTACITMGSNTDPLMKMKRDILVTVYSILVFTVFAALSFPEVLFYIKT